MAWGDIGEVGGTARSIPREWRGSWGNTAAGLWGGERVTGPWGDSSQGEEGGTAQGGPYSSSGGPMPALPPPPCAQGLERTEHEGFGGGNTAWEEEKLAKYQHRWVLPSRGWGV